jgi:hypothetical protein
LDSKVAEAQGYIAVDQALSECNDVYGMTKQDAKSLTAGVKSLVDDLFEGNIKGFIEDGFSSAIKVLAGQSKGDMKILTAYKLAMRVRGTNPDVTVANVFMFNYAFKYDGLLSYGESAAGYCAVYGSVKPGSVDVGTMNSLLNQAWGIGEVTKDNFEEVKKNVIATYCKTETIVDRGSANTPQLF